MRLCGWLGALDTTRRIGQIPAAASQPTQPIRHPQHDRHPVPDPTTLPAIDGKWRLLYTSRPGSASPIQRTFTGVEAFSIFQQIDLAGATPRVNNIVDFGERFGYLIVQAEASTDSRPLEGFTPRCGRLGGPCGWVGSGWGCG